MNARIDTSALSHLSNRHLDALEEETIFILREVAAAIAALGRSSDVVARYGGEEFVLVAPASDVDQALALAQRACAAVQALALPHLGSDQGVITLSCGVAAMVPQPDQDSAQLLRAADAALYRAKHQGRNQAVAAGPEDC